MMNFNNLPCEIKSIIFEKNRKENNKKNVEKKLKEFNDEWGEDYQDDLISAYMFDDLKLHEKINIYKRHQRMMNRHCSIMCDGSALDEDYENGVY